MTTTGAAQISEEDILALRESIRDTLIDEADSLALHAHIDGTRDLSATLNALSGELGWMAIALPEDFGGFGMGAAGAAVLHGELGRVCAPGAFIPTLTGAQVLAAFAGDLCGNWLPRILSGEASIALPAVLAGKGSAAALPANGSVSGQFTLLGAPDAALALLPAGDGLVVVDLAGATIEPQDFWDRTRTVTHTTLNGGMPLAMLPGAALDALTQAYALAVAADSIGLSHTIIAKTIDYMKERQQFGRPIGSFQALKHRVVDLVARVEIAENVVDHAVETALTGDPAAAMWTMLAKAEASDAAAFIAGDCIQLHGGVGFTWEYDVHIHAKRARLNQMLVATNRDARDSAAADLARLTRDGVSTLEIATA